MAKCLTLRLALPRPKSKYLSQTALSARRCYVSLASKERLLQRQTKSANLQQTYRKIPVRSNEFAQKVEISTAIKSLKIRGELFNSEGKPVLSSILLRDACHCSQCVDPSTQQRNFSFVDIPGNVRAIKDKTNQNTDFAVRWENDIPGFQNHLSSFSLQELLSLAEGRSRIIPPRQDIHPRLSWDKDSISGRLVRLSYEDYMSEDRHLLTATSALSRDGLLFINNVPPVNHSISKLVERIGPIYNSFYGQTWDVQSKPNADNVAYTHKDLGFHMDLLYMHTPPTFQFLHCIQNTCAGGESRFADTMRAREILEIDHLEHTQILKEIKVEYQYQNLGHNYASSRPVFTRGDSVFWSPPFVGRLATGKNHAKLEAFLSASKVFASILDRQDLVYETKMEEGTCAIFTNTRIVHARNAFDVNSGRRWLRGAYLGAQPFLSTDYRLRHQLASAS